MLFFKLRSKILETLSPEMVTDSKISLEHVIEAVGRVNPLMVTATYLPDDRTKVIIEADIAELITLWSIGFELKAQSADTHALIAKLLKI